MKIQFLFLFFTCKNYVIGEDDWQPIAKPTPSSGEQLSITTDEKPSAEPFVQFFRPPTPRPVMFPSRTHVNRNGYNQQISNRVQIEPGRFNRHQQPNRRIQQPNRLNNHQNRASTMINRNRIRAPNDYRTRVNSNNYEPSGAYLGGYGGSSISRMDPLNYSDYGSPTDNEEGTLQAALDTLWSNKASGYTDSPNTIDVSDAWLDILKNHGNNMVPPENDQEFSSTRDESHYEYDYDPPTRNDRPTPKVYQRYEPDSPSFNRNFDRNIELSHRENLNDNQPIASFNGNDRNWELNRRENFHDKRPSPIIKGNIDRNMDLRRRENFNDYSPIRGGINGRIHPGRFRGVYRDKRLGANRWTRSGRFNTGKRPAFQLVKQKDGTNLKNEKSVESRLGVAVEGGSENLDFIKDTNLQNIDEYDYDYEGEYIYDDIIYGEEKNVDQNSKKLFEDTTRFSSTNINTKRVGDDILLRKNPNTKIIDSRIGGLTDRLSNIPLLSNLPNLPNLPTLPSMNLPRFDTAVTVMSFIAFSVFVANLAVKAIVNGTTLPNVAIIGREEEGLKPMEIDHKILFTADDSAPIQLNQLKSYLEKLPIDFDMNWMRNLNASSTLNSIDNFIDVGNYVYENLHEIAGLGLSAFKDTLGIDPKIVATTKEKVNNRIDGSGKNITASCTRRLLCHVHQIIPASQRSNPVLELLPYWTFGISWLTTEGEETPRLLEDLRAEVAGQNEKDCQKLFPDCPDTQKFNYLLNSVKDDVKHNLQFDLKNSREKQDTTTPENQYTIHSKQNTNTVENPDKSKMLDISKNRDIFISKNSNAFIETEEPDEYEHGYFPLHSQFIKPKQ